MEIKILVAIPCVTGEDHVKESIQSVGNKQQVDVLICDNGATKEVKDVITYFGLQPNINILSNPTNVYVNPAWNQFMDFFLANEQYSHLIIMNSDATMQKDWSNVLIKRWQLDPTEVIIPVITTDKGLLDKAINTEVSSCQKVYNGTAGVFITMSRRQCEMVGQIPNEIKVWFGDNYIYNILRSFYTTIIPENLILYTSWSRTIQKIGGIHEIIEQDKLQWENKVEQICNDQINYLKNE